MAAGELGRRQLALDLDTGTEQSDTARPTRKHKPRQVVLYVHLSEAAITGHSTESGVSLELARVENHRQGVTADQVRTWCANPDTQVTVKPVIDLAEHIRVDAYEVPDRLAEQTQLRDGACVFPWCTRPARPCDSDHVIPHAEGGPTCSCNIAPLVPTTSPPENPLPMELHRPRTRDLPVVQPARLPVPPRPPRHPRRHHQPTTRPASSQAT